MPIATAKDTDAGGRQSDLVGLLKDNIVPLPPLQENNEDRTFEFARHFDAFADCKVLLIGDASHGTSEFYAARAEITKYMVERHGFNVVATEADWPDAEAVDRYVRRRAGPVMPAGSGDPVDAAAPVGGGGERERPFSRFPTWMWRNGEVHEFVEWLRAHNKGKKVKDAAGYYGLDLYSMGSSMRAVISYLDRVDGKMAKLARQSYGRLMPWAEHPHEYGLKALSTSFQGYEKDVIDMLRRLLSKRLEYAAHHMDGEEFHSGEQNARLVADAENYYKAMYYARASSWNLRDTHMFQTLVRILKHRGPDAKAIVWAHNSHLGDARATGMGRARGELNLGQLCREAWGDDVRNIGCSTYTGTVAAADEWDGDMRVKRVRPGMKGSYEELMHRAGEERFLLDLRAGRCDARLRAVLMEPKLERFIGVLYLPETERQSHYSGAVLPEQFDGWVWFDETKAVRAFETHQPQTPVEMDETWPFGL